MKTKKNNTELTNAERHLLAKVKSLKKRTRKAEHERDIMKSIIVACGVDETTVNEILGERPEDSEFTERDRYR